MARESPAPTVMRVMGAVNSRLRFALIYPLKSTPCDKDKKSPVVNFHRFRSLKGWGFDECCLYARSYEDNYGQSNTRCT